MPLPEPRPEEDKEEFVERCMADEEAKDEFPSEDVRFAVCSSKYDRDEQEDGS